MKKLLIIIYCFCFVTLYVFSAPTGKTPKNYVKEMYGDRGYFFDENLDGYCSSEKIEEEYSPIYFYNSSNNKISFEFHEIKTKFGLVVSDKIFPIKGRTKKITLDPNSYLLTMITMRDLEHFLFVLDNDNYEVFPYVSEATEGTVNSSSFYGYYGFESGGSSSKPYNAIIFEFAKD